MPTATMKAITTQMVGELPPPLLSFAPIAEKCVAKRARAYAVIIVLFRGVVALAFKSPQATEVMIFPDTEGGARTEQHAGIVPKHYDNLDSLVAPKQILAHDDDLGR